MQSHSPLLTIPTLAAFGVLLAAIPATADSMTLMFDGPDGFGVSEAAAMEAQADAGIPILTPEFVGEATDILSVVSQDLRVDSIDPFPPLGEGPHTATSDWLVQNESLIDLLGTTYLLFVTTDPSQVGSEPIDYQDGDVGLSLDPALGWVLIRAEDPNGGEPYYYPALELGSLWSGEVADPFAVHYFIDGPMELVAGTYVLPEIRIGLGFTAVPEPGTAGLVALGLLGLAFSGRRPARGGR